MTVLLTCKDYSVIEALPFGKHDLPRLCAERERERNDGYAVIASTDGRIVADAEGYARDDDSAERRYRDQIDRVCGYLD